MSGTTKTIVCTLLPLIMLLASSTAEPARAQAPDDGRIDGRVTDAAEGLPLPKATIALETDGAAPRGAATDPEGRFVIDRVAPGRYVVTVRFLGYRTREMEVMLAPGERRTLRVALEPTAMEMESVVVTASRRREKLLDAPASVSVLEADAVARDVVPSAAETLREVPGVDMARTGIDRREIVLRGFNNAFSGAAYVMTDYRQAALASLGVNAYNMMPANSLDIARVEVVRGPGSALYGPGVAAGVVHFITKDPFTHPGTSFALSGGERSYRGGALRHAGTVGRRFGYKVTGQFAQARDWTLDASDPHDAREIERYHKTIPRDYDVHKASLGATAAYRFRPDVVLTAGAGYATANSVFLSSIGTLQSDGFGARYGQLRLQAGGFFAQAYLNLNDAADSFVYGSQAASLSGASVVDRSRQLVVQAQHAAELFGGRQALTFGVDFERTTPVTGGTITGRNEDDDLIQEVGAYVQSETDVTGRLTATLAARLDYDNVFETPQLSPRAALVFKVTPRHSLRATYNRALASPTINSQFLDITAVDQPLAGGTPYRLVMRGRGTGDGFTFDRFRETGAARFLLPVDGFFGRDVALGAVPLAPVYGAAAAGVAPCLADPGCTVPGLTPDMRLVLAQLMGFTARSGALGGAATGAVALGIPDDGERGYAPVAGPVDIAPLDQTVTQTVEIGYKGLVADRLLVTLDGYFTHKRDFIGPLVVESPLAYLQGEGLARDAGAALGQLFATTDDPTIRALLTQLEGMGLPAAQAAALLGGLTGGALADVPVAVVQPDQPVLPGDDPHAAGGLMSYRNFGRVQYYGADAAARFAATDRLDVFGSLSWVSDDFFDHEELGEESEQLSVALNASALKVGLGGAYRIPGGLSVRVSGRYTDGFRVKTGPYVGAVDSYFLLDAGIGYDFGRVVPGLRMDVTVQNVLDEMHREFIGAPRMGRLGMARLSYAL